ncbi:hypothetical protein HDC90_002177 [Pedobacter sp. AK013]|uniref:hypothetical protein n=1 Tax=Pedobacter sp. AK013 TaxID=2723071 RepID=UPI00161B8998|nr:hypothetical protein [Pedobacter sp. AK013]MBB6237555.1 hypothetical protein [Pedobacter sp. AK013]
MKFFPSQSFILHSDISVAEAWNNLSKAISKDQNIFATLFPKNPEVELFKGYIYQSTFTIQRNLSYRNSFQAEISGEIFTEGNGCKVDVQLSLMPLVKGFLMIWCSLATVFALYFFLGQ